MASGAFHLRCMWISDLPDHPEHPNGNVRRGLPATCTPPRSRPSDIPAFLSLPSRWTRPARPAPPGKARALIILLPFPLFVWLIRGVAGPLCPPRDGPSFPCALKWTPNACIRKPYRSHSRIPVWDPRSKSPMSRTTFSNPVFKIFVMPIMHLFLTMLDSTLPSLYMIPG